MAIKKIWKRIALCALSTLLCLPLFVGCFGSNTTDNTDDNGGTNTENNGGTDTENNGGTTGGTVSGGNNTETEEREMTNHAVYDGVALPDSLWQAPAFYYDEQNDRQENDINGTIQAIYYRSDYNGEESYAFAYLGIPEGVSATNKAPAVLLVHGGGGTAYWQWVREWVNRGYVALAMDLEGHVPKPEGTSDNMPADLYVQSEYSTPHNQNYGDAELPIEQTWMYYAVSTAIRGNSLLHNLDCVDRYKIGVCGVSWGGVITSIISGYDDRFAFSIPIYISLNLAENAGGNLPGYYKNHAAARVWDDDIGLTRVETPILFLAMNNDPNATPNSVSVTAEGCKNATIALVRNWAHSHSHAFARLEPYAFADSIVKGSAGLVKVENAPSGTSGSIRITVPEGLRVRASIAVSGDSMTSGTPSFEHFLLTIEDGVASYTITEEMQSACGGEVRWYYIWFEDNYGRVVSTTMVQL